MARLHSLIVGPVCLILHSRIPAALTHLSFQLTRPSRSLSLTLMVVSLTLLLRRFWFRSLLLSPMLPLPITVRVMRSASPCRVLSNISTMVATGPIRLIPLSQRLLMSVPIYLAVPSCPTIPISIVLRRFWLLSTT